MQAQKIQTGLQKFSDLLQNSGNEKAAHNLALFSNVFKGYESKTITNLVNHIKKSWKAENSAPAYPQELAVSLKNIEEIYRATSSASFANDFKKLQELFLGEKGKETENFVSELSKALEASPTKKKASPKVDQAAMRKFSDQLTAASGNNTIFYKLIDELSKPRNFTKAEVDIIAEHFLGYKAKHKTKKSAIEEISSRQQLDAIGNSQISGIKKIAV